MSETERTHHQNRLQDKLVAIRQAQRIHNAFMALYQNALENAK